MIAYEELDKALARWKGRSQNAARELDEGGAVPASPTNGHSGRMPARPDRTGEIDLGDVESVVETYEES